VYKQVTKLLKTPARTCLLCGERLVSRGKQKRHGRSCKVLHQKLQRYIIDIIGEFIYSPIWRHAEAQKVLKVRKLPKHHKQQKAQEFWLRK
jgi:hypothetical protein